MDRRLESLKKQDIFIIFLSRTQFNGFLEKLNKKETDILIDNFCMFRLGYQSALQR